MAPAAPIAKGKKVWRNKGSTVTAMIEEANAAYLSAFSAGLAEIGAVFREKSCVLPRLERLCPEFEINKYVIENDVLYISNGCHLFSNNNSINRDEFTIGNFITEEISINILNLICFYHISFKTLKLGEIVEIGIVDGLPDKFTHVLISFPFFMPDDVSRISNNGFIYNLSWILPICREEVQFIKENGIDEFESRMHDSQYDFFDVRNNLTYLNGGSR